MVPLIVWLDGFFDLAFGSAVVGLLVPLMVG